VCKKIPRGRTMSAMARSGWIVPTSLLASMTLTSTVRSVSAASSAPTSTTPWRSTGK
jgi:hypothetical protein